MSNIPNVTVIDPTAQVREALCIWGISGDEIFLFDVWDEHSVIENRSGWLESRQFAEQNSDDVLITSVRLDDTIISAALDGERVAGNAVNSDADTEVIHMLWENSLGNRRGWIAAARSGRDIAEDYGSWHDIVLTPGLDAVELMVTVNFGRVRELFAEVPDISL